MSFALLPNKTKLTLQSVKSESWEENYPNKCPLWLNVVGWSFVFVPFLVI